MSRATGAPGDDRRSDLGQRLDHLARLLRHDRVLAEAGQRHLDQLLLLAEVNLGLALLGAVPRRVHAVAQLLVEPDARPIVRQQRLETGGARQLADHVAGGDLGARGQELGEPARIGERQRRRLVVGDLAAAREPAVDGASGRAT